MKAARAKSRQVPGGALLFQRMYTRIGCQGRPPQFIVEFYPYANLTHSIRLRHDSAHVRLSDVLRGASRETMEAAAAVLLARLYRKHAPREYRENYRAYSYAHPTRQRLLELRRKRARRKIGIARGAYHDLAAMFHQLNTGYFQGALALPRLGWSVRPWRSMLGSFDPALHQIAINCLLDRREVPAFVVEYVLYHEMLHQKHPMKYARCRLESHSRQFREEEKRFRHYDRAIKFLERFP
jgi:predicted metal-dependent hydrolase